MTNQDQNRPTTTWQRIQNLIAHPLLNGFATLLSITAATRSDDVWIRLPATILALGFSLLFLSAILPLLYRFLIFLGWKFFAGLLVGLVMGTILYLVAPRVEFMNSTPPRGGTLVEATNGVIVRFSEPIPWPYYEFMTVEIKPSIPIEVDWSREHQLLTVTSNKDFPAIESGGPRNLRFEYNSTYYLTISSPILVRPVEIEFRTLDR